MARIRIAKPTYWIAGISVVSTLMAGIVFAILRQQNLISAIYFRDSAADLLRLGNRTYEIGFHKQNGGIAYILDKNSDQRISLGNLEGCLWEVNHGLSQVKSCQFSPAGPNLFSYAWSVEQKQLVLTYRSDPTASKRVETTVRVTASEGHWFDLGLEFKNGWFIAPEEIKFPAFFVFSRNEIEGALLPVMPGIALEPGFFERGADYEVNYPGYPGVFADFMALSSLHGQFAMYALEKEQRLEPAYLGFNLTQCAGVDTVCYIHNFQARVPVGATWTSPRMRVRISENWEEAIRSFREDAGVAGLPSLPQKLGALYDQLVQLPLYKADVTQLDRKFADFPALLEQIPHPGLLHLVAYEARGFDRNYPDFLPPDERWGTTQELAAMFDYARAQGYLVMPYINPTWWDGQSPTLQHLPSPLTIKDVAARSNLDVAVEECYGCPASPHYGYVMSPYVPFVQERLDQLIRQMQSEAPYDLLFEDQIGARANVFDYNPASPAPEAGIQGWIEHTQVYSDSLLMTECGFTRLFATEIGFHGSALLAEQKGENDAWWGEGSWHYYPFVTQLGRDKALFYQHDLAPETFTHRQSTLAWNVAMGYMLSYDLFPSEFGGGVQDEWLRTASTFQKFVLSRYASERLTSFAFTQENLTRSAFESYTAYVNWDADHTARLEGMILPPLGMLIQKNDGSLWAGVFTNYKNTELSSGSHYLIEERDQNAIVLRQMLGSDTYLNLPLLESWTASTPLEVWALSKTGESLSQVPANVSSHGITFRYQQVISGQPVDFYRISQP